MKRVRRKFRDLYWWVRHRTFDKYHVVDTGLEPGYYDKDMLMFHAMFQLLVDFVEEECADMHRLYCRHVKFPPSKDNGKAGLEYLKMHSKDMKEMREEDNLPYNFLDDPYLEIITLYRWWTEDRPRRYEAYDIYEDLGNIGRLFQETEHGTFQYVEPKKKEGFEDVKLWEVEDYYSEEDTEMACRLVRIRNAMWT